MKKISLSRVLTNLFLATLVAFAFAPLTGGASAYLTAALFAITTVPQLLGFNILPIGALQIGVATEVWVADIAENIHPRNNFIIHALDDSRFLNNKTVRLPQAGADPVVVMNRAVFPATVSQRTDTELDYDVEEWSTDPIMVGYTEEEEASYDVRQSILRSHLLTLNTKVADYLAHAWAVDAVGSVVRTSGDSRLSKKAGQSGNRLALTYNDFVDAMTLLNNQDVPEEGRVALIDAVLYGDLLKIEEFIHADKFGASGAIAEGAVGRVLGIDIYVRSRTPIFNNSTDPTKEALDTAVSSTSNLSCMVWHPHFVRRAFGNEDNGGIKVSINPDRADYNGATLISALVRAGGKIARADNRGVVSIVETAA